MQVSWDLTARAFFDQLSIRDKTAVERAVVRLVENWEQLEATHLHRLAGLASKDGCPLQVLRVGRDLRVLLYRKNERITIIDVLRHSQIERLRTSPGFLR